MASVLGIVGSQGVGDETVTLPTITGSGRAYIFVNYNQQSATPSISGWTLEASTVFSASYTKARFSKDVTAADSGASVTVTYAAPTSKIAVQGFVILGYDLATLTWSTDGTSAAATTHTALTQTGQSGTRHAIAHIGTRGSVPVSSITAPAGYAKVSESYNTGSGATAGAVAVNTTDDTDGTLGGGTWSFNGASQGAIVSLLTAKVAATAPPTPVQSLTFPLAIAHRFGSNVPGHCENTIVSAQKVIANQPSTVALECDVGTLSSAGGEPAEQRLCLTHEPDDLSTGGKIRQSDLTTLLTGPSSGYTVAQWDAAVCMPRSGVSGAPQPVGRWYTGIAGQPGLAEILVAQPSRIALPEIKDPASETALLASITARGLVGQTIVQSFSYATAQRVAAGGYNALYLTNSFASNSAAAIFASGIRFVGVDRTIADLAGYCTAAHAAGLKVFAYTVNSTANRDSALAAGVDGYFTDRPDVVNQGDPGQPDPEASVLEGGSLETSPAADIFVREAGTLVAVDAFVREGSALAPLGVV